MVASGQDYSKQPGERHSLSYASQKDADEKPEEQGVTMMATDGMEGSEWPDRL